MLGQLYNKYWEFGFQTSLYDVLTPASYRKSFQWAIGKVSSKAPLVWLDVGCGSGQFLDYFEGRLKNEDTYWGLDCSMSGLRLAQQRVIGKNSVRLFLANFENHLPFKDGVIDITIMHFALYILPDRGSRLRVLKSLFRILKSGGRLIVSNPSIDYDSIEIIRDSLRMVLKEKGRMAFLFNKLLVYPLTRILGLRFIEEKLKSGQWKAYTKEEIHGELVSTGFCNIRSERTYSDSSWLTTGEKRDDY